MLHTNPAADRLADRLLAGRSLAVDHIDLTAVAAFVVDLRNEFGDLGPLAPNAQLVHLFAHGPAADLAHGVLPDQIQDRVAVTIAAVTPIDMPHSTTERDIQVATEPAREPVASRDTSADTVFETVRGPEPQKAPAADNPVNAALEASEPEIPTRSVPVAPTADAGTANRPRQDQRSRFVVDLPKGRP